MPLHLKPIGDEEDRLESFIVFYITPHDPIFRAVIGSQNMVLPTILVSR